MSLERWWRDLKSLKPREPTTVEIRQLFDVVDRELNDAQRGVSNDNRFNFCYNAAHTLCVIALHAEGYETSRHAPGHHATVKLRSEVIAWLRRSHADLLPADLK